MSISKTGLFIIMGLFIMAGLTQQAQAAMLVTPYASTPVGFGPGPVVLCSSVSGTLQYGQRDSGEIKPVTMLQNFLYQKGYLSVSATGYFGPQTRRAVIAFQSQNGLAADGIVGAQTEAHIRAVACPPNGTTTPTTAAPVISSITPTAGPTGTVITISGSGFTPTDNIIHFSAGGIGNISSADGNSLSFTVPTSIGAYCKPDVACPMYALLLNAGSYPLSVENANGTSNTLSFTITNNSNAIPN